MPTVGPSYLLHVIYNNVLCFILPVYNVMPNPTGPSVHWALPFGFPPTSLTVFHPFCNLWLSGIRGFQLSQSQDSSVHCAADLQHLAQCNTTSNTVILTVPGFPLQLPWVCHCQLQMNCSVG